MLQKIRERLSRSVQRGLEEELARLKTIVPFEEALAVCWTPLSQSKVSGEVVGNTIYVYDKDPREAKNTLKHEYLDCLLTRKMVQPLIAIVNTLIKLKETEIYQEKEKVVSILSKLV